MTDAERTAVIDECIRAVLSLRDRASTEERESVEIITGAVCFRLMLLKPEHAALREQCVAAGVDQ